MWFPVRCQIQLQLVSLHADGSSICSTCQSVSCANRTPGATTTPDQSLRGLQWDAVVTPKAGYFYADCRSNSFSQLWVGRRCLLPCVAFMCSERNGLYEHFSLKRKFREKKWRSATMSASADFYQVTEKYYICICVSVPSIHLCESDIHLLGCVTVCYSFANQLVYYWCATIIAVSHI